MVGTAPYARIVNGRVTFQVVRNGRLTAERKGFVDVRDALVNAP